MKKAYTLKSGELLEIHGSLKSAYEASVACFDNPVVSTVMGKPGPDCWIKYETPSMTHCKKKIKECGYYEIEEKGDDSVICEIQIHTIIR